MMPTLSHEMFYGPEIRGVVCAECGGTLVHYGCQIYCDWCDAFLEDSDDMPDASDEFAWSGG